MPNLVCRKNVINYMTYTKGDSCMKKNRVLLVTLLLGAALILTTAWRVTAASSAADKAAGGANSAPYTIQLQIGKDVVAQFREISGLESAVEVVEYQDGSDPVTHKRAGKAKYKNIVLKRGLVNDPTLSEWFKTILAGKTDRKSGSIIYLDREGNEVLRYNFFEAWPCRWKAPELNASSDTNILEEIEFVVEKVERA